MTPLRVLSLGWGVQSFTLAAMAAVGEMEPVDVAIHADTLHERAATDAFAREWTPWLAARGVEVVTVQGKRASPGVDRWGGVTIPAFTQSARGDGQLRRQCTQEWKIAPLRTEVRSRLARGQRAAMLIGISRDEWSRQRTSNVAYIEHQYPLVERGMTRRDCEEWLRSHGLPVPVRSSCVFCPYHSRGAWAELKRAGGADWHHAVAMDEQIRGVRPPYPLYVHPARLPLSEAVVIPEDHGYEQSSLLDDDADNCAAGVCFV